MKGKSGQITLFIILGIVILIIAGSVFYFNSIVKQSEFSDEEKTRDSNFDKDSNTIRAYVDSCFKLTTIEGLKKLGVGSGYITPPDVINLDGSAYWYLDQVNIQPMIEESRQRLQKYIDVNLQKCNLSIFESQGFDITKSAPESQVSFDSNDVFVKLKFPINVKRGDSNIKYEAFSLKLDIRYRKIFEVASQIMNRLFEYDFKFSDPLLSVDKYDFEITKSNPTSDTILFNIKDNTRFEGGDLYEFKFISRHKPSKLIRRVVLQNNSATVGTVLPIVIYSLDRLAQLNIHPETTMIHEGQDVSAITVEQHYIRNVSRYDVPFHENFDDSVTNDNITWTLRYPVYSFGPSGMRFNQPQKLFLFWDEDRNPHSEELGILYDDGEGWRPIPSKANYEHNFIYSDIPGFSNYTIVDCADLSKNEVSANALLDPGSGCFIKLIVIVVVLLIIILITAGAAAGGMMSGVANTVIAGTSASSPGIAGSAFFASLQTGGFLGGLSGGFSALIGASGGLAGITSAFAALTTTGMLLVGGLSLVGGVYINQAMVYGSAQDSIAFSASCPQSITITEHLENGVGSCTPKGSVDIDPGTPTAVSAQLSKCKGVRKFLCGKCSLSCKTSYK